MAETSVYLRRPNAIDDFFARLRVQGRVLHALVLREMLTRFGRENLGFFWLMGEPLLLTIGVMILWSVGKGEASTHVDAVPFALTGYTLITLWRHIVSRGIHCFRSNAGLMYHRNVNYIDTLCVRALLEIGGTGLSFLTAYTPLFLFNVLEPIDDPLLLIGGWLLMGWVSFGVALILAGITEIYDLAERFIQPIMYITLPGTGLFFMIAWLPDSTRRIISYVPLINAMEMFRDGFFGHKLEAYWDGLYTVKCCIVLTAIGLLCVRKARKFVHFD